MHVPLIVVAYVDNIVNNVYTGNMAKELLSVRIETSLKGRLDKASNQNHNPYAPTKAKIVERGIELALRELDAKKGRRA